MLTLKQAHPFQILALELALLINKHIKFNMLWVNMSHMEVKAIPLDTKAWGNTQKRIANHVHM